MKYFAYGSNMNQEQMRERCPDSKLITKVVLKDYKIAFTIFSPKRSCGCADILNSTGDEVWGLLYDISENDLKNLDVAEACPDKYYRSSVVVQDELGQRYYAEAYKVAKKESDFLKPSKHYLGLMLNAAQDFDFPASYTAFLKAIETI